MLNHNSYPLEQPLETPPYDLEVLVPVCARDKYAKRLQAFQHHGLLNASRSAVRLTLLAGEHIPGLLDYDWKVPVRIVDNGHESAPARIYDYYARMTNAEVGAARWYIRVDDDSITDVDGLVEWLDANYDWQEPHYLMAGAIFDILAEYREAAVNLGFDNLFRSYTQSQFERSFAHEWESCVLSQPMLRRILERESCRQFFAACARLEGGFGDHGLAVAARMTGFTPAQSEVLSCAPEIDNFSLFGGDMFHIHFIAPDLEHWDPFLVAYQQMVLDKEALMAGQQTPVGGRHD